MNDGLLCLNARTNRGLSRNSIVTIHKKLNSHFMLIENDPELVQQMNALGVKTIYRQSGDEGEVLNSTTSKELKYSAEQFVATRAEKGATYIHGSNEVVTDAKLQEWTRYCLDYAVRIGQKFVPFSYGTHAPYSQWKESRENAIVAVRNGMPVGAHMYLDDVNNSEAWDWLKLKREIGGLWFLTEFAYIRNFKDAGHGWIGAKSADQYSEWIETVLLKLEQEGNVVPFLFSVDTWPDTDEGEKSGFGIWQHQDLIDSLSSVNKRVKYEEKSMTTQVQPPTGPSVQGLVNEIPQLWVNIRNQPSPDSDDIGNLYHNDKVDLWPSSVTGGWVYLRRQIDGVSGWVSLQDGKVVISQPPDPAKNEQLMQIVSQIRAQLTELATLIGVE